MRIPGIGVVFPLDAKVVMPHETMIEPGPSNVRCTEGSMSCLRRLQVLAEVVFRTVKEGQIHTPSIHLNSLQKIPRLGRLAVGNSPDGETVVQNLRFEVAFREDPNIGAPVSASIDAVRPRPVMISGCQEDRSWMQVSEGLPDKGGCVGRVEFVLVQVSGAEQSVNLMLPGQISDLGKRVSKAVS